MRSSTGNGGVSASLSTSSVAAATSISPVGSVSLTVPSGRWRTVPVTRTTYSLRTRCTSAPTPSPPLVIGAGVDHHLQDAGDVAHVEEHDPAVVTAAVDPSADDDLPVDVGGPEIAGAIGAHHRWVSSPVRGIVSSRSCNQPATSCRGTSTCSPVCMSFTATAPRSGLLLAEHDRVAGAGLVGGVHLLAERAPAVRALGAHAVLAELGDQQRDLGRVLDDRRRRTRRRPARRRGRRPRHRTRSAPARCRCRSRCRAWACRPSARPDRRSDRRRRCRSARRRAPGSRTRTWCSCSSRGRARGGG